MYKPIFRILELWVVLSIISCNADTSTKNGGANLIEDEYPNPSEEVNKLEITEEEIDTFQQKISYPNWLAASEGGLRVQGDFDGDGNTELLTETIYDQVQHSTMPAIPIGLNYELYGNCITLLYDSNSQLAPLVLENAKWGLLILINEGNIDGINGDELGILLRWPQSCWHGYYLYGYQNGEWRQQTQASVNTYMEQDFKNIFSKGEAPHQVISLEYGWNDENTEIVRPRYLINLENGNEDLLGVIDP